LITASKCISNSLDRGLPVHVQTCSIAASKCIFKLALPRPPIPSPNPLDYGLQVHVSKLARLWPPCASPNSVDRGIQVNLQTSLITASKCISKLLQLRPPSSHDHGLQVHISILARSWPPSGSPNSFDRGVQVHIETSSITASKCISELARSQPPGVSLHSPNYGLQVHTITASKCISKLVRSRPRKVSLSSLDRHFQALLELLSSTACSQSRFTVCRWVVV
jgi:hypothetical protein